MRLLLAALVLWIAPSFAPIALAEAADETAVRDCLAYGAKDFDIQDEEGFKRELQTFRTICQRALFLDGANPKVKLALARAWSAQGFKNVSIPLIRAAAAQGEAGAYVEVFETYRSFTRRDENPLIGREEAQQAYRRAAELGHPGATYMLAIYLDRGSFFKRDPNEAIVWAERAEKNPPKDNSVADVQVTLGRLLSKSTVPEQRARGLDLLSKLGRGDAKTYIADAIRAENPVRARELYEEALGSYPGHAIPPLSDMLIKGEGGAADAKRAVKLVNTWSASDVPAVRAARGRMMMEGKYMERDPQKGIELIAAAATWSNEARNEVLNLLAEHPSLRLSYADNMLFDAYEAAQFGESGALAALIGLTLSTNDQFRDIPYGCALVEWGAAANLPEAKARLPECTVSPQLVR